MKETCSIAWFLLCVLLLGKSYALGSVIVQVPSPTFANELNDPKYIIAMNTKPSKDLDKVVGPSANTVNMTNAEGQRFVCVLPTPDGEDHEIDGDAGARQSADSRSKRATSPQESLRALGSTCFFRVEGWWTYELCIDKHVRQFHQEKDSVVSEFFLGHFDEAATARHVGTNLGAGEYAEDTSSTGAIYRYHSHIYTNGTACDLTDKLRQTEVRYACNSESATHQVVSIKEPTTCHYVLIFYTPLLCTHPSFQAPKLPVSYINCHAVDPLASDVSPSGETKGADAMVVEDTAKDTFINPEDKDMITKPILEDVKVDLEMEKVKLETEGVVADSEREEMPEVGSDPRASGSSGLPAQAEEGQSQLDSEALSNDHNSLLKATQTENTEADPNTCEETGMDSINLPSSGNKDVEKNVDEADAGTQTEKREISHL
eukprot:CAMPEP_0196583650 /NCGR_PEP_ID=MMETSP1081-20130531/44206_1 /TAXON_ID=36882 /ORGANISM="Pyramimonas amylifera, Strain CCMP720" /LENGTH=430 /DNA_ID=CAMNT_0041904599 /DNA_START=120 /DNA_END=1412 /DNA_ORIENTATION=+